jgi:hypothetical protein
MTYADTFPEDMTSAMRSALRYLAGEDVRDGLRKGGQWLGFPRLHTLHALERRGLVERNEETMCWQLSRQGWILTTGSYPISEGES